MKKIGIVGGVSWLSTLEYYKAICLLSHQQQSARLLAGPPAIPEMSIESLNINKSFNLRGTHADEASWQGYDAYFRDALKRLERSGADFAIIASNTPHNRFDAITDGITMPVINIFDAVARECASHGATCALILGTAPTMASPVFPDVLQRSGIAGFVPPSEQDRASVTNLIDDLQAGGCNTAADEIKRVVDRAFLSTASNGRKLVCLSCTELPLAFPEHVDEASFELDEILYLNTTVIHAKAAFDYAVAA